MTELTVLNSKFEAQNKFNTEVDFAPEKINVPVVHQVVKAILAGRRQGNACTKTRAEVIWSKVCKRAEWGSKNQVTLWFDQTREFFYCLNRIG